MNRLGKYILEIGDVTAPITVRKSKKARNFLLHVDIDGSIELVIPRYGTIKEGNKFLARRQSWLTRHVAKQRERHKEIQTISIVDGSTLPLFGDQVTLSVVFEPSRKRSRVYREGSVLHVVVREEKQTRDAVTRWYKKESLDFFIREVSRYSNVSRPTIRINNAKTQWGSCNKNTNAISFNWKLALMPRECAEYVVVHEIAHLTHANHSNQFWRLVEQLMPDYKTAQYWLKKRGHSISL